MADIGRASVPSQNLGIANEKNSVLQGSKQEFSNLSCNTQESDHQYNRSRRSEIGTRSIRSGAAMVMYLAGVPVFSIMLIGIWSSTAFLRYIRKQIQEFLQGISSKRFRSPTSTRQNHSDPGSPPRSSQHPSAECHQRTRRNNPQKITNTRPKLEVAVG
jgi:hypothetical protein